MRKPDFNNLLTVLERKSPSRPTLFEFFLNEKLYAKLAGISAMPPATDQAGLNRALIKAFAEAGYDYATVYGSTLSFPTGEIHHKDTKSANEGAVIFDRASFHKYPWPEPDSLDYTALGQVSGDLPDGMKLIVCGPGGVLENVMELVGYEATCLMVADDPKLIGEIFEAVGSRLVRHYEIAGQYATVGAMISNDDWGFKTQTMLSPADMRKFVFPWHKKISRAIHESGRPAILHSCGQLKEVMDDIVNDMKYDGKHSYEDAIQPVEEAYEEDSRRIAILGGIDLDFVVRSGPEKIRQRSAAMLDRSKKRGAFALGTGNSVPPYVPDDHYFAMTSAALDI
jgi:uroporphyrinogen decarboxylase